VTDRYAETLACYDRATLVRLGADARFLALADRAGVHGYQELADACARELARRAEGDARETLPPGGAL